MPGVADGVAWELGSGCVAESLCSVSVQVADYLHRVPFANVYEEVDEHGRGHLLACSVNVEV